MTEPSPPVAVAPMARYAPPVVIARPHGAPDLVGTSIGGYQITRQLAQGGSGAVFLAVHRRLGTRKAVKVLLAPFADEPTCVQRFATEAAAVARLDHRHVIKIDDYGQLPDGTWYILMPYVDGESLEEFLEASPALPLHVTLHILVQISAALDAAHAAGIVHRDLKPTNILLSRTASDPWHVTLVDFGIAKLSPALDASETYKGQPMGTPIYMAAEQFEDAATADVRADVFSLGVIAYRMATGGAYPFGNERVGLLAYRQQLTRRPQRPGGVPAGWADTILAALSLRPASRPATARAFALALAAATPAVAPTYPGGDQVLAAVAREFLAAGSGPITTTAAAAVWPPLDGPLGLRAPALLSGPVPAVGASDPTQRGVVDLALGRPPEGSGAARGA